MSRSEYEGHAVRWPSGAEGVPVADGAQEPGATLLSDEQVPGASHHATVTWISWMPDEELDQAPQVLDHDQLLLFVGMDWRRPQALGATVELVLGGQPIVFNTTTSVHIPAGTPYGPVSWKELRRPHVQVSMVMGSGETPAPVPASSTDTGADTGDQPSAGAGTPAGEPFDFEQYVIRSPMREAGPPHVEGRQNPTMTYLSRIQISRVNDYLEFGWIWDVPRPSIPKMRHDNYDEIVFHIGSDPDNPGDLGGTLQFGMGDGLLEFDETHCVYVPRLLDHGPLVWTQVRRPLIEIAMMLGAGTYDEGWENSFFDLPDGQRRGAR